VDYASLLLMIIGIFLVSRMISGAMADHLSDTPVVIVGLVLGLFLSLVAGLYVRTRKQNEARRSHLLAGVGCGLNTLVFSALAQNWWGGGLLWLFLIAPLTTYAVLQRIRERPAKQFAYFSSVGEGVDAGWQESVPVLDQDGKLDPSIDQWMIRRIAAEGPCTIEARIRGRFVAGERTKSLHVGFCPPLESIPEVTIEQSEGPEADIAVGQRLHAGVRCDVRLRQTATTDVNVVIALWAGSTSSPGSPEP
jgi:hypothetical protein